MDELIEKIKSLSIYCNTSYYTHHLELALWRHFSGSKWNGIPYYLKAICEETKCLIKESPLIQEDILKYIANSQDNSSYFYVSQCILLYGISVKLNDLERYSIASGTMNLPQNIVIDEDILSCAVACFVLDGNRYNEWDIEIIVLNEQFAYSFTDYKLTKVTDVDFRQSGFIYNDNYYLYNIFINRKPIEICDKMPAVFQIISDNIDLERGDLYLRLDERLAVPLTEADITHRLVFEKFRGLSFGFANTKLEQIKNIIVNYDPETLNKLLMVIKKDYDSILNEEFWHIELEQLPYIDRGKHSKNVCTTFIHGKYYPALQTFKHIDFIKNQYPFDKYCDKQNDSSKQDIQIDYYTTKECHYKIWCIENIDISEETWYKLTSVSLSEQYRKLFNEILERV
ncbi:MAG TPA: hypothetical protein VIM42_03125 [Clostridium sp.]